MRAGSPCTRSSPAPSEGPAAVSGLLTLDNTAIVLDSTADPCEGYFDLPGIFMVPLISPEMCSEKTSSYFSRAFA